MSDPVVSGWDVAGYLWKGCLTLAGAIGLYQVKRIDKLEDAMSSKSNRSDTDKDTSRLEEAMKEHRSETREGFAQINTRLDSLRDTLIERLSK